MGTLTKILIGGVVTALLGWLTYNAVCNAGGDRNADGYGAAGSAAVTGDAGSGEAATEEQAQACQADINTLMTSKTIQFQSGSAYLAPESTAAISELATELQKCAGTQVEVQGHTDLTGGATVNQTISQSRAETVVAGLVEQGVPASQLTAKGYGSTQPLVDARTSDANAKNRRTVLVVTTTAAPTGE